VLRRPPTRIEIKIEDIEEEWEQIQRERGDNVQPLRSSLKRDRSKLSTDQRIGLDKQRMQQ